MCKSGGFNHTKFMSNSKEVLATIPEEKRKEGGKDITKRGLLSMISSIYNPLGYAAPFVLQERRILQLSVTKMCNRMKLFSKMFRVIGQSG